MHARALSRCIFADLANMREEIAISNNMTKKILNVIFAALALSPLLCFAQCTADAETSSPSARYELSVKADESENSISVDMTVTVKNTFADNLDSLVFAFYPDAFTLKTPLPVDPAFTDAAYPYGLNAGSYSFLQAGGRDVKRVSLCETPCRIEAFLSSPLGYGQSTEIVFSYDLTLPVCATRYGCNDFSVNLTFFYPVLCRYKDGDFAFEEYCPTGDPFAFDCAEYSLSLDCPQDWQVLCSAPQTEKDGTVRKYRSEHLRDLAIFMSPEAQITTLSGDGYTVNVMHDGSRAYAAKYALDALTIFSSAFGDLPSDEYSLVFTPFMTAGAEFSNAAMISSSLPFSETEKTVAHETAHQWWYYAVGSDQVSAPWQDEALAQWSTLLYFEKRDMRGYADALRKGMNDALTDYLSTQSALGEDGLCDVSRKITDYRDATDYYVTVYCKAALAADICAKSVTTNEFCRALAVYAKRYALSFATDEEMFAALDESGKGTGRLFRATLFAAKYR